MKAQRDALGESLVEAGEKNSKLVVVDADIAGATRSKFFKEAFPSRFFNVGISEQDGISAAAGLAKSGLRSFFVSFGVFTASRYDQVRTSVAYSNAPVVLVGTHAGLMGKDGASHQALEDITLMSSLPNIKIYQPADPLEVKQIVEYLSNNKEIAYLRISRHPQENVLSENHKFVSGKANNLLTNNSLDAVIFSTGYMNSYSLEAAKKLSKEGICVDVVNFSTLKPIDSEKIIEYAKKTVPIFTVEDHSPIGGLGSRVSEVIAENKYSSGVFRLGVEGFGESGNPKELYIKYGLDPNSIANKIKNTL